MLAKLRMKYLIRRVQLRELRELQQAFQAYVLEQNPCIAFDIVNTASVSTATRLDIYRDGYYLRLIEALEQDYPVLRALLGDEQFDQLCREYIDHNPSRFRSIRWFGNEFADYLQKKSCEPHLVEMAQFEWLLTESFDAADTDIVTVDMMSTIAPDHWPEMQFKCHPSLRILTLNWNTTSIWKSVKEHEKTISPQQSKQPVDWIIWRKKHEIQFCSMQSDEIYMLNAMQSGASFAEICEGLCEWIGEQQVTIQAAILLKRYILDELISEIV